ncbi:MAG TPA: MOSC N-terminal beta barrel domain-containing protein [Usitatibacter sp.]|nr:MOSC N-terminal beta barrel domain-containing protein [Usitatibacter sp.]
MPLTVAALHIYPVKGLKGVELPEARTTERGLEHDRRWMVVDAAGEFVSQRMLPRMATVWTALEDGALELSAPDMAPLHVPLAPDAGEPIRVRVWSSECDALAPSRDADAWLSEYLDIACRLVRMPESTRRTSNALYAGPGKLVGFADGYACLATSESSLADLNARLVAKGGRALPMNRFRPNVVVTGGRAYDEDAWKEIAIGEAVFRAAKPCGRCQVTTTDQSTGEVVGPEPLATLAAYREHAEFGIMFGMNWVMAKTGTIRVGDTVEVRA